MNQENNRQLGLNNAHMAARMVGWLVAHGVDTFFVAPGSRCTPLTLAIANHPEARAVRHFDERGLAYMALGRQQWLRRGEMFQHRFVALVCTLGTAVANFMPAIVEAKHARLRLLVITADRPAALRETAANQTINQMNFFGVHADAFVGFPALDERPWQESSWAGFEKVMRNSLVEVLSGVVHWNVEFDKPLEMVVEPWLSDSEPLAERRELPDATPVDSWPERGVIVAGTFLEMPKLVLDVSAWLQWPVYAEVGSGLRGLVGLVGLDTIQEVDSILLIGDRLVRRFPFSGRVIRVGRFMKGEGEMGIPADWWPDAEVMEVTLPQILNRELISRAPLDVPFIHPRALPATLNELAVARVIAEDMPDGHRLFLGNSLPVRLMSQEGYWPGREIAVGMNRGASGIDGLVASAAGFCLEERGTLLIGDLSLLHDLNSLALAKNLVVVVLNNDGGAIFGLLPVRERPEFEDWFVTPHGMRFAAAAEQFGLQYECPDSLEAFRLAYRRAEPGTIIEVVCDREETLRLLGQV